MPKRSVGRFQVMAMLQAARAHRLGLKLAGAKSWGLNRAIFIAAAKRGFGPKKPSRPPKWKGVDDAAARRLTRTYGEFFLGEDKAYKVNVGGAVLFTIGGEIQTAEAFKRQVQDRLGVAYRAAWKEAQKIVREYPRKTLESPEEFYTRVYKPRRDKLAARWNEMSA